VPFLPYQTPALAAWKTALEDMGYSVKQVREPVIGQNIALDVMISRLEEPIGELDLEEK
jgi:hypothetical protein